MSDLVGNTEDKFSRIAADMCSCNLTFLLAFPFLFVGCFCFLFFGDGLMMTVFTVGETAFSAFSLLMAFSSSSSRFNLTKKNRLDMVMV